MELAGWINTIASALAIVGFFISLLQIRNWWSSKQFREERGRRRVLKAWLNVFRLNVIEQSDLLAEVAIKKNVLVKMIKSLQTELQQMEMERSKLALALLSSESERRQALQREQELARQSVLKQRELQSAIIQLLQWNAQWDKRYGLLVRKWE